MAGRTEDLVTFPELAQVRATYGYTKSSFCNAFSVSRVTLNKIESGLPVRRSKLQELLFSFRETVPGASLEISRLLALVTHKTGFQREALEVQNVSTASADETLYNQFTRLRTDLLSGLDAMHLQDIRDLHDESVRLTYEIGLVLKRRSQPAGR